ncbi:MAG: TatD family hydrolase [Clostridia bacterium]|nr:TatD family hydrolase [Clostridia bacterium]
MTFVDTHCHLDDPKLKNDLDAVVNGFRAAGVGIAINIGCELVSSRLVAAQAEKYDGVYFAAGFHPQDVADATDQGLAEIAVLAARDKCVAIGEIGLDYYWDRSLKEKQAEYFIKQIELARFCKLPINVHVRDATGDALKILKDNKNKLTYGGVMHCFSGSLETAKELVKIGMHLAFGGTLTFKNARSIPEVAAWLPLDRLLTETDSPYLAPEPLRGTVNTPKNIPVIVEKLAQVRGAETEEIKETVYKNVLNLFPKIKPQQTEKGN